MQGRISLCVEVKKMKECMAKLYISGEKKELYIWNSGF